MRQNKHFEKSHTTLPFRLLRSSIRRANLSQRVKALRQQPVEIDYSQGPHHLGGAEDAEVLLEAGLPSAILEPR